MYLMSKSAQNDAAIVYKDRIIFTQCMIDQALRFTCHHVHTAKYNNSTKIWIIRTIPRQHNMWRNDQTLHTYRRTLWKF